MLPALHPLACSVLLDISWTPQVKVANQPVVTSLIAFFALEVSAVISASQALLSVLQATPVFLSTVLSATARFVPVPAA